MDLYGPEVDRTRAFLAEMLEEEAVDSDDEDEELEEMQSKHDSSSEQEGEDDENDEQVGNNYYIGKDGVTKWRSEILRPNVRIRAHNTVTHLPGVIGDATRCLTPKQCFQLFISQNIMHQLVLFTNKCIKCQQRAEKETTEHEMLAVLGLLYLAGIHRASKLHLEELWAVNGTGIDIFQATMSLQRFKFLLSCLRFDDQSTRVARRKVDKLAPIRDILDEFVHNLKVHYSVGEYVTLDEKVETFHGKCAFRICIPNKPVKTGLKLFALVDARTFYTTNLEVFVGQQPDGPFKVSNKTDDIVERMIEPISGTQRNITMDNWFASCSAASRLLNDHKLTMVGMLRKNQKEIPQSFINTRGRQVHSSIFGFHEDKTLVSYVPKKHKVVLLLSTLHHDAAIDASTGDASKPEINTFYTLTKCGIDVVEELSASYDVSRNTRRWPTKLFFALMNVAGINTQIIYESNTKTKQIRRKFLTELALDLIGGQVTKTQNLKVPREMEAGVKRHSSVLLHHNTPGKAPKQGRCVKCPRKKDRKTKKTCARCDSYLCLEHLILMCTDCANIESRDKHL